MAASFVPSSPVPTPTPVEAEALAVAAAYLHRAGTQAATILLGQWSPPDVAVLFGALRDQLLGGAALCDGLLDLPTDHAPAG